MRINAYILAADPAWIEASVLSYYDIVDRIVVSYDESSMSWTGTPIDVEQCLRRLRSIDKTGKFDYRPGHFARSEFFGRPMANETYQRQLALNQASDGADWVLQLDTDEVLPNSKLFRDLVVQAAILGRNGMTFPSRGFSHQLGPRCFLEFCERGWRGSYGRQAPYALAVGSTLVHARRHAGSVFHVDCRARQDTGQYPHVNVADWVVSQSDALLHLSWVRSEAELRKKFGSWGHAKDRDWSKPLNKWLRVSRHPIWSILVSQFDWGNGKWHLRPALLPKGLSLEAGPYARK